MTGRVTFDFTGTAVWITGAAGGMGARHAERFASSGARLGLIDTDSAALDVVVERIRATGGTAEGVVADVSDWEAVLSAADELRAKIGPSGVLVANAGVIGPLDFAEDVDVAAWRRVLDVNLSGAFLSVKAAIPQMRSAGGGSIVLISSVAGLRGYPGWAPYNTAKHGVVGLMRTLANELAADGVRVNAVCPGYVDTPMLDAEAELSGLDRDELSADREREQLIERVIIPDEISDAVLWLASDAAAMVTGVTLPVDGGLLERTSPAKMPATSEPRGAF